MADESIESADRIILLKPLRKPDKGLGKLHNKVADTMLRHATRHIRKAGIETDQQTIDFRPGAKPPDLQEQELKDDIQLRIDKGDKVRGIIGSSAGGHRALKIGHELGIPAVSNQGRLAKGTSEHTPSLEHAARNHPEFENSVLDFEENVAPQISNGTNPDQYLTIGAPDDSVVPRNLKKLPGVHHVEIDRPKGVLGLVSKIPGVDHAVALYQGLRHPALLKHIQKKIS